MSDSDSVRPLIYSVTRKSASDDITFGAKPIFPRYLSRSPLSFKFKETKIDEIRQTLHAYSFIVVLPKDYTVLQ